MKHWFMAGSHRQDYELGVDESVMYNGKRSGYIKPIVAQPGGFGTLMQKCKADTYRNKRLRFTAAVRTADVTGWVGLWMRVDGPRRNETLAFDNMKHRPITGTTDWQQYEVVLDVSQEADVIAFGMILHGSGTAWISNIGFEEVDDAVLVTSVQASRTYPDEPSNLDFSEV